MSEREHRVVAGRYRLIGPPLGRGGMGIVWRARDDRLGRDVALKQLTPPPGLDEQAHRDLRTRFRQEARAAARLEHPGIVAVHDVLEDASADDGREGAMAVPDDPGTDDGRAGLWIVMQLVEGRSLDQVVRDEGPLPPDEVARIGLALVDALDTAHRAGIVHRDVTPRNVLLADDGRVLLTDFGIATLAEVPGVTEAGALVGTPAYIAPERLQDLPATAKSDLWSLGSTLYHAVEGRPAFQGTGPGSIIAAVLTRPPEPPRRAGRLGPVLLDLLASSPEARPDAAAFRRRLGDDRAGDQGMTFGRHLARSAPDRASTVAEPPATDSSGPDRSRSDRPDAMSGTAVDRSGDASEDPVAGTVVDRPMSPSGGDPVPSTVVGGVGSPASDGHTAVQAVPQDADLPDRSPAAGPTPPRGAGVPPPHVPPPYISRIPLTKDVAKLCVSLLTLIGCVVLTVIAVQNLRGDGDNCPTVVGTTSGPTGPGYEFALVSRATQESAECDQARGEEVLVGIALFVAAALTTPFAVRGLYRSGRVLGPGAWTLTIDDRGIDLRQGSRASRGQDEPQLAWRTVREAAVAPSYRDTWGVLWTDALVVRLEYGYADRLPHNPYHRALDGHIFCQLGNVRARPDDVRDAIAAHAAHRSSLDLRTVTLIEPGPRTVTVVGHIQNLTGVRWDTAQNLASHAPQPILHGVSVPQAEAARTTLQQAGATVTLTPTHPVSSPTSEPSGTP